MSKSKLNGVDVLAIATTIFLLFGCSKENTFPQEENESKYATKLYEYVPAPGQFINESLGNEEAARSILGGKDNGLVSLGAFGGYIVLGFDHAIINRPNNEDFAVYGNVMTELAEPGIIWVMQDENNNKIPDDTWYEIKGSEYGKEGYQRNYSVTYYKPDSPNDDITWKDNEGKEGVVKKNGFHHQAYFPLWRSETSFTVSGSLLPSTNIDKSNDQYITSLPFDWGYADNDLNGTKIDLDNAIDAEGNKVTLNSIDFIKVQTGILADLGSLGELSTEVTGLEDLNIP